MLDALVFYVHLNLKYHNVHGDSMMINTNVYRVKIIYKTLQHDDKEEKGKAMKINVGSLSEHLKDMATQPLQVKYVISARRAKVVDRVKLDKYSIKLVKRVTTVHRFFNKLL